VNYSEEVEAILRKATCTVEEAARVLGVGRRQAYAAVKSGEIPSIHIGGRILISTKKLTALIEGESL
jgi:excisionase family DNA binding protein